MNSNRSFWGVASIGGLVIGFVEYARSLMQLQKPSGINWLIGFSLVLLLTWLFTVKYRNSRGSKGIQFSQAFAFIVAMMVIAGVVSGILQSICANYIFKEVYENHMNATLSNAISVYERISPALAEMVESQSGLMYHIVFNPLMIFFISIYSFAYQGIFYGAIIGAILQRQPDIFADQERQNFNQ